MLEKNQMKNGASWLYGGVRSRARLKRNTRIVVCFHLKGVAVWFAIAQEKNEKRGTGMRCANNKVTIGIFD